MGSESRSHNAGSGSRRWLILVDAVRSHLAEVRSLGVADRQRGALAGDIAAEVRGGNPHAGAHRAVTPAKCQEFLLSAWHYIISVPHP